MTLKHRRLLRKFWEDAEACTCTEDRFSLLDRLIALPVVAPENRYQRIQPKETVLECWCCGDAGRPTHWHHLIPVRSGGKSVKLNFVPLCDDCHFAAHNPPPPDPVYVPRKPYYPEFMEQQEFPCVPMSEFDRYEELSAQYDREQLDKAYRMAVLRADYWAAERHIVEDEEESEPA